MKIEIFKLGRDEWYFRIVAKNGKTISHSQLYKRKRNARQAAALIADANFTVAEAA